MNKKHTRVCIIYPADPIGAIPGGIDTFIRGILGWAPGDRPPAGTQGAHVKGENADSIGICLIGEGDGFFTPRLVVVLQALLKSLCVAFRISPDLVFGHRAFDSGKTCPGFDVKDLTRTGVQG